MLSLTPPPRRPRTIPGQLLRLALLRRRSSCLGAVLLLLVTSCLMSWCSRAMPARVATFNIENFPQSERQVEGAFEAIGELGAEAIAVQEITDPLRFQLEATRRLGPSWRFVHDGSEGIQHVGVLYDSERFELAWSRSHRETQIDGRGKPALEVRLRRRGGGRALRLFVVHLKAGGDFAEVRREQLRRLAPIVRDAVESWDELVLLGDFNATGEEDRATLRRFARALHLHWASEPLACTSYWARRDGCRGSALDHVFTREAPEAIAARGPCEELGCEPGDRCPAFHREVSDHCPVTVDF